VLIQLSHKYWSSNSHIWQRLRGPNEDCPSQDVLTLLGVGNQIPTKGMRVNSLKNEILEILGSQCPQPLQGNGGHGPKCKSWNLKGLSRTLYHDEILLVSEGVHHWWPRRSLPCLQEQAIERMPPQIKKWFRPCLDETYCYLFHDIHVTSDQLNQNLIRFHKNLKSSIAKWSLITETRTRIWDFEVLNK
jgi:hypothetical protein